MNYNRPVPWRHNDGFQSTRPRGRTRQGIFTRRIQLRVSIHASSREDATGGKLSGICQPICFNPRVLAGGRDMPLMMMFLVIRFQSTRPRGRTRREIGKKVSYDPEFQSTRPRGRTRRIFDEIDHDKLVSIHASSREDATVNESSIYLALQFKYTRPRGRTRHLMTRLSI